MRRIRLRMMWWLMNFFGYFYYRLFTKFSTITSSEEKLKFLGFNPQEIENITQLVAEVYQAKVAHTLSEVTKNQEFKV